MYSLKKRLISKYTNWSFDTAVRYLPVVDFINCNLSKKSKILEVGSGNTGIAPYIKRNIIGLDKFFYSSSAKNIKIIKGDVKKIPFHSNSFDLVLSMDMLEHLSPKLRKVAVKEMARVAKKYLVIGFPSGIGAARQDEFVAKLSKDKFGKEDFFIGEHLKYKLPSEQEFIRILNDAGYKKMKTINNFPIFVRKFVLRLLFSKSKTYLRIYFMLNFIVNFFMVINIGEPYRKIHIYEKL